MKHACVIILLLGISSIQLMAEPISPEKFRQIPSYEERLRIISEAPPAQKVELEAINRHLTLLSQNGGEEGLREFRKIFIGQAKGFGRLIRLTIIQNQIWEQFIGSSALANERAGMALEQRQNALRKLEAERDMLSKRVSVMRELVFNLAVTPQAVELNRKAQELCDHLQHRNKAGSLHQFTKAEREAMDNEIDAILEELARLPRLSPEQAQNEYESFTEDKLPIVVGNLR